MLQGVAHPTTIRLHTLQTKTVYNFPYLVYALGNKEFKMVNDPSVIYHEYCCVLQRTLTGIGTLGMVEVRTAYVQIFLKNGFLTNCLLFGSTFFCYCCN